MALSVRHLAIPDVLLIEPDVFRDERGYYTEPFSASHFAIHGLPTDFLADGHAHNARRGILRGLHYQAAPFTQGKLVRCTQGECFDVVVDLRRASETFGRHVAVPLSAERVQALWVPPGFAHGYVTLTERCDVQYKFTHAEFSAPHGRALRWNDPALGIDWPVKEPILNARDAGAPKLSELADLA